MKKSVRCLVIGAVVLGLAPVEAWSQGSTSIPRILQITREFTKPGKAGMIHDQKESAFVEAMAKAKWPTHYLGLTSLSGKQRAIFLTPYASFDAWQKDNDAVAKNSVLSSAIDRASMADGDLLESMDQGVFLFRQEFSFHPRADLSPMRFLEVFLVHVKPGHDEDWSEIMKMVIAANEKALPDAHWGCFVEAYGGESGTYLFLTGRKSSAELDRGDEDDKKFMEALGKEGQKKLGELWGASVESSQQQLFAVNPRMSYVAEEWIKSDPDFWKPKAAPGVAKPSSGEKNPKP